MAKSEKVVFLGTGRRKSSIARVRLVEGKGNITINGKDIKIGDKVTFNINPKFVDSRVRRDYR